MFFFLTYQLQPHANPMQTPCNSMQSHADPMQTPEFVTSSHPLAPHPQVASFLLKAMSHHELSEAMSSEAKPSSPEQLAAIKELAEAQVGEGTINGKWFNEGDDGW